MKYETYQTESKGRPQQILISLRFFAFFFFFGGKGEAGAEAGAREMTSYLTQLSFGFLTI